jgi:hypothetical protein
MITLFISNDPKLLDPASAVRARMRSYAGVIGTLHIICRAPKGDLIEEEVPGGKLYIHAVQMNRLGMLIAMPRIIRSYILAYGIEVVSAQDPFEHGWIAARAVNGTTARLHIQIHTDFLSRWFLRDHVFRSP